MWSIKLQLAKKRKKKNSLVKELSFCRTQFTRTLELPETALGF